MLRFVWAHALPKHYGCVLPKTTRLPCEPCTSPYHMYQSCPFPFGRKRHCLFNNKQKATCPLYDFALNSLKQKLV